MENKKNGTDSSIDNSYLMVGGVIGAFVITGVIVGWDYIFKSKEERALKAKKKAEANEEKLAKKYDAAHARTMELTAVHSKVLELATALKAEKDAKDAAKAATAKAELDKTEAAKIAAFKAANPPIYPAGYPVGVPSQEHPVHREESTSNGNDLHEESDLNRH